MEMSLFSDEQILKAYTKDIERETAQKDARQFALRLLKLSDISVEKIAELTDLSAREVNELKDRGI